MARRAMDMGQHRTLLMPDPAMTQDLTQLMVPQAMATGQAPTRTR